MTLTQLEYAIAVATYKSFVAAAEKCFVTQPTLSMQILKLEEELGVKLFDRNKHPIAITEIGKAIIEQAKNTLSESKKIEELVKQKQETLHGNYRIAVIPTLAPYILPTFLNEFNQRFSNVQLFISEKQTDDIIKALKNDELDAALVSTPLGISNIKETPLFFEPLVAYFSPNHKALKKKLITAEDIDLSEIWLLNEGHCLRNQVIDLCSDQVQKSQSQKSFRYESSNVEGLRKMVEIGGGFTVLPELATLDFTENQQDNLRYFSNPEPVREISLITNERFVHISLLDQLIDAISSIVPKKMRIQTTQRKILRIQSASLE